MTELSIIFNNNHFTLKNEGDIFFWNHLVDILSKYSSLSSDKVVEIVFDEYFKLTGEPLTIRSVGRVKGKDFSIFGKFWIDNFIHSIKF